MNSGGEAINDLPLQVEAGLLHPWGAEIGCECRNIVGKKACQVDWWRTCGGGQSATYCWIRIRREDLARVELGIVEKEVGRGNAVVGRYCGGIDLRDSRVKKSVPCANYQWTMFAQGIREANAGSEIICVKGNFS